MKKIIGMALTLALIIFASISMYNFSYADNTVDATLTANQTTEANQTTNQTQITTTVSSTSSADDEFLSPTNIINILLIAVGVVLILLAIAILTKIGKGK